MIPGRGVGQAGKATLILVSIGAHTLRRRVIWLAEWRGGGFLRGWGQLESRLVCRYIPGVTILAEPLLSLLLYDKVSYSPQVGNSLG